MPHPKLRSVDLANEGEYLAGLAHSPRFIDETIAHAKAVAGRAATILSRAKLDIAGQVAKVDPEGCVGRERLRMVNLSAAMAPTFVQRVNEIVQTIEGLGPNPLKAPDAPETTQAQKVGVP